jgi:hypothetical protein
MALYDDKISIGCKKVGDKLVCYAYDLSTLPIGAEDPSQAKRKCEIVFGDGEPQFSFTGKGGDKLCYVILENLAEIVKKSSNLGLNISSIQKAMSKLSLAQNANATSEEE